MDSGRVTGSNDVIATLSARISELSKRVALLQAELEAAQKRAAIYEEHDDTIQGAISGALRAAYSIRERAETTAEQILEQAREERRMLLKEIERLRDERDALQQEIAERRRGGIAPVAPRPLTSDAAATELRAVASEALRGLFQEIVEDIRSAPERPLYAPEPPRSPLGVVPPPDDTIEIAPARMEAASPVSDIQVVLSPIASFPRLAEIERHIQALPVVRTLYVRDYRGGVATLAVALRSPMTPEGFAGMLGDLLRLRMRLVSGSRNMIELTIEGETSIA